MESLSARCWGEGDRVCLLLHGAMADANTWQRVAPAIAATGYRVVALDLPGHGDSPPTPNATLAGTADAVLAASPIRPEVAIGHSLGGLILAEAIGKLRASRAVYVDTPFDLGPDPVEEESLRRNYLTQKRTRTLDWLRRERPHWREEDRQVEAASAEKWDVETAVNLYLDMQRRGGDLTPGQPQVPSLIVHPEPSSFMSPTLLATLRQRTFTTRGVPNASHSLYLSEFDEFMSTLTGWL